MTEQYVRYNTLRAPCANLQPFSRSRSSPSPPPNLGSFPPTSLASLPTEVLVLILSNIPRHPSKARFASLARICLVNRFFLSIAQPLLYHDISIDLEQTYDDQYSTYYQLVRTLTTSATRANLVKAMRVSFFGGCTTPLDMVAFAYVLTQLHQLESIRSSWYHQRTGPVNDAFVESILNHQKGLKSLEIPIVGLKYDTFASIFTTLSALECFVGDIVSRPRSKEGEHFEPICNLRRLVVTSSFFPPFQLFRLLSSSHSSLTSLAFELGTPGDPFDLSSFSNLAHLKLVLAQNVLPELHAVPSTTPRATGQRDPFSSALRPTLISLGKLPIKSLSVSTHVRSIALDFRSSLILDVLPSSVLQLSIPYQALEPNRPNSILLTNRISDGSYPHLKHISILPTYDYNATYLAWVGRARQDVRAGLEQTLKKFGVRVEVVEESGMSSPTRMDLDPWQTDSDSSTETEDDSSDSDTDSSNSEDSSSSSDSSDPNHAPDLHETSHSPSGSHEVPPPSSADPGESNDQEFQETEESEESESESEDEVHRDLHFY